LSHSSPCARKLGVSSRQIERNVTQSILIKITELTEIQEWKKHTQRRGLNENNSVSDHEGII